jgi:hypothetical protein
MEKIQNETQKELPCIENAIQEVQVNEKQTIGPQETLKVDIWAIQGKPKAKNIKAEGLVYLADGDERKPRLVKQSKAAEILQELIDDLAYDNVRQLWMSLSGDMWKRISDTHAFGVIVSKINANGGSMVGYDSTYPNGIAVFLKSLLSADDFDQKPYLIPFKNGVLDINTGLLLKHDKAHRLTWQLPFNYSMGVDCQPVIDWLKESVSGDSDQVELLRAYIRAVCWVEQICNVTLKLSGLPVLAKGHCFACSR